MNAIDSLVKYGYLVVFGAVFAEQVGLPFPSEPFLLATGGAAGSGHLSFTLALGLAALASLVGDTFWYWLGRSRGPRVLGWLCRMSLEPDTCSVQRAESLARRAADDNVCAREPTNRLNRSCVDVVGSKVEAVSLSRIRIRLDCEDGNEPCRVDESARHAAASSEDID